ncbi:MAG: hypothetical protein CFE21_13950 [Bacteroidetes bacterium B1(2017)]|nr:MAG: hypothetical protein CFE21_13950 [Bacteroidetes bacterium B1(2017)]
MKYLLAPKLQILKSILVIVFYCSKVSANSIPSNSSFAVSRANSSLVSKDTTYQIPYLTYSLTYQYEA